MLYLEAFDFCKASNTPAAFLFLDFQKAFDRVERSFLFETMEHMNFGPLFIKFCQTLYSGSFSTRILVNGHASSRVDVKTGVSLPASAALLYTPTTLPNSLGAPRGADTPTVPPH